MNGPELELEGTWEEIKARAPDFGGRRLQVTVRLADAASTGTHGAINDALEHIWQTVPDSSWQTFPSDFGTNLDHYLYSAPKRV